MLINKRVNIGRVHIERGSFTSSGLFGLSWNIIRVVQIKQLDSPFQVTLSCHFVRITESVSLGSCRIASRFHPTMHGSLRGELFCHGCFLGWYRFFGFWFCRHLQVLNPLVKCRCMFLSGFIVFRITKPCPFRETEFCPSIFELK